MYLSQCLELFIYHLDVPVYKYVSKLYPNLKVTESNAAASQAFGAAQTIITQNGSTLG